MNDKGFTLVEMLAVIVILAVIAGIAIPNVLSTINTSKNSSEKIFTEKLATSIKSYIELYGSTFAKNSTTTTYTFEKCQKTNDDGTCVEDDPDEAVAWELVSFNLSALTESDSSTATLLEKDDIINPKNDENCLNNSKDPTIRVFKDDDYVYYYYVDLSGDNTSCDISDDVAILTNIPSKLCSAISREIPDIECD